MKELRNPSFSQKHTVLEYETGKTELNQTVPTLVRVKDKTGNTLAEIKFQDGPISEAGVNGVFNEDLLLMVISRLEAWQKGKLADPSAEKALEKLYEATFWLRRRTDERKARGVLETHRK